MANKSIQKERGSNAFRGFVDLMSETIRAQQQWFNRSGIEHADGDRGYPAAYVPLADIYAIGDDIYVRCEVAGVRAADVSVTVTSGVLTIAGRRDSELDEDKVVYHVRERMHGEFRRSMLLPEGIDRDNITAEVSNGLVKICVKGAATATPHSIEVADHGDKG